MTVPAAPLEPARLTQIEEWAYEQGLTPEQGASHPVADLLGHIAYLEAETDTLAETLARWGPYTGLRARAFGTDDESEYVDGRALIRATEDVLARHAGRRG